jgi:ectoine hydroxylase-related dioxygenase (phytanoyl-CoA dioxygenase family)
MHESRVAEHQVAEHQVAEYQVAEYQAAGHLTLHGVVPRARVEAVRPTVEALVREATRAALPLEERDTYGKAFLQVQDLNRKGPTVRAFVWDQGLAKIAASLMGVPAVRFYFDQALFKEPGGGATPWHQDHVYWPLATEKAITAWIPLVDVPAEMGTMEFVRGSHHSQHRHLIKISDESEDLYSRLVAEERLPVEPTGAMAVGDVSFHASWALHRAMGNGTPEVREVLAVIYFEDGAALYDEIQGSQRIGYDVYFSDLKPGDVAGSELMPVL